ncbi:hypothetical protein OG749_36190 [Streptomyces nojiriensis]|uniref:hypothetical protein n=1 Tax=Streptomyces nojiriensis TaxID=66374 RepID=UPI002E19390C
MQHSHFAIVTVQSVTGGWPQTMTWTASLTFPPAFTRQQAFDHVMGEFVRTNPSMANHVVLFYDLQRNTI